MAVHLPRCAAHSGGADPGAVDVMKELPATLVLRPFDFNTLAVRAFEMASDERLADAGPPALMIVAVGLIPVMMLSRALKTQSIKTGE